MADLRLKMLISQKVSVLSVMFSKKISQKTFKMAEISVLQ